MRAISVGRSCKNSCLRRDAAATVATMSLGGRRCAPETSSMTSQDETTRDFHISNSIRGETPAAAAMRSLAGRVSAGVGVRCFAVPGGRVPSE